MVGSCEINGAQITPRRECLIDFPDGSRAAIVGWTEDFGTVYFFIHRLRGDLNSAAAAFILDVERNAHGDPDGLIESAGIITPSMSEQHEKIFQMAMITMREDWGDAHSDFGVDFHHLSQNRKEPEGGAEE